MAEFGQQGNYESLFQVMTSYSPRVVDWARRILLMIWVS
jgi:hypothetical protein